MDSLTASTLESSRVELPTLAPGDLAAILDAWQSATDRLQRTHESLKTQVQRLTDELEAKNRELARRDRLADLGQMASHVAHEVRNGIVPLKLYLGMLRRQTTEEPISAGLVERIATGFSHLESTVDDLLTFTADREPRRGSCDIAALLTQVLDEMNPHLKAHEIVVQMGIETSLRARVDEAMVRRAAINLVLNAVDAMNQGGVLQVSAARRDGSLVLQFRDNGPGIASEVLAKLFDPFVTTKSSGTGLGLAIVDRIAEAHGGRITGGNHEAGGAVFELILPDESQAADSRGVDYSHAINADLPSPMSEEVAIVPAGNRILSTQTESKEIGS